jgi:hypothetical protein
MRLMAGLLALALSVSPAAALASEGAIGPEELKRPDPSPVKGAKICVLGGVEGYTGPLASLVGPGIAWGVMVGTQPLNVAGGELWYSGASNALTDPSFEGGRQVRNGAGLNVKFSLTPSRVEPYVYGGIGFSIASYSEVPAASGYSDDFYGVVPVGAGFNFHLGTWLLGVRGELGFLFGEQVGPAATSGAQMWNGRVELGARF